MSVAWAAYDAFSWSKAKQSPIDDAEKAALTDWAADILELPAADRQEVWGHASPPGRYAATVIHLAPRLAHAFWARAAQAKIDEIGIKLFKTTADAQREARRAVEFHAREIGRLPGLPNPLVQRSLGAGMRPDQEGDRRGYVVQEWVAGESLEDCLRVKWRGAPIDAELVRGLLRDLFSGIVIPLWQAGTIWWDVRDANFCLSAADGRLRMIDVDSLAAYAQEILGASSRWDAREKGRETALARLRRLTARLLAARHGAHKARIEGGLPHVWSSVLEPQLRLLGRKPAQDEAARAALEELFAALAQAELL